MDLTVTCMTEVMWMFVLLDNSLLKSVFEYTLKFILDPVCVCVIPFGVCCLYSDSSVIPHLICPSLYIRFLLKYLHSLALPLPQLLSSAMVLESIRVVTKVSTQK